MFDTECRTTSLARTFHYTCVCYLPHHIVGDAYQLSLSEKIMQSVTP